MTTTNTKTFSDEITYDDNGTASMAQPSAPQPQRKPRTLKNPGIQTGNVDAEGAARATSDEEAARSIGLSPKPPVYEIGSRVNSMGVKNFRASREKWESMPTLPELAATFGARIAAEERRDHVIPANELIARDSGLLSKICHKPDGSVVSHDAYLTERAFMGLASHVTPAGSRYLAQCPPELRAVNLNHWLAQRNEGELTLRVRNAPKFDGALSSREVYAVCGPRYAAHDVDKVMAQAAEAIGHDARAKVRYDGYRMTLDAVFHTNIEPEKAVAGEMFKAMIRMRAADDGSGSINVSLGLWRNLCLNLIIIDFSKVLVGRRSHIGADTIADDVRELIAVANERIGLVVGKWSEANVENVLARYDLQDVDQVFRGLVVNGAVKVAGVKHDDMIARLHRAWEREPGYSKASILNAITRAAHEEEWRSYGDSEDLESTAGELLYQPVWNLDVSEKTAEQLLA